jgi:succinate dehydrogenase/fumarate reductase iron-sulfur protein
VNKLERKTIKVKIARFDPSVDSSSRYQAYEVPFEPRMTVMDVLDYIYENLDPTLAYHSHTSCHRRICARCNLTVNKKPGLSCHTEVNGDMTIEPLPRFKVIRDLVVEGL